MTEVNTSINMEQISPKNNKSMVMEMNSDERDNKNFDNEEWVNGNARSAQGQMMMKQAQQQSHDRDTDSSFCSVVHMGGQAGDFISEEEMQRLTNKHEEETAAMKAKVQKLLTENEAIQQTLESTKHA